LFSTGATSARDRGILIHSMFEQVRDPSDFTPVLAWWNAQIPQPEPWQSTAMDEVRACLDNPDIRAALGAPGPGVELWRERTFDVVVDGAWVTGTFDRVLIENNRARIIDFKTDAVEDEAAIRKKTDVYRPQLALYRRALGLLTGIPELNISTLLILTRPARVCELAL
jgi:ATP-dependent exoDNAse (exonuclease V) beta subunit